MSGGSTPRRPSATRATNAPPRYPIRAVSKLTGLGIDTLRAWERRHKAVTPTRGERGRVYSEADVVRLRLLRQAIASGHSIGQVATLGEEALRQLASPNSPEPAPGVRSPTIDTAAFADALLNLDTAGIDREFSRLATVLPPLELVRDVLLPTLGEVGDRWNRRQAGIAQEHLISSTVRSLLGAFLRLYTRREASPRLVFATPAGDRHEIGILGAAMLAANAGLGVSYIGPDLPAREIVEAVKASGAQVLVLGLTLSTSADGKARELRTIVRDLPREVELWAGGRGVAHHAGVLAARGLVLQDLDEFERQAARLSESAGP